MKGTHKLRYAPAVGDDERVPAGGKELRSIQMMGLWENVLELYEPDIMARLKMVPNGLRQYRMIRTCLHKLVDSIFTTIPNSTIARIAQSMNALEMRLYPRSVVTKEYFVVDYRDFIELLKAVDDGACRLCLGDKETARRCQIRRILMDQVPPVEGTSHTLSECPYSDGVLSIAAREAM